jgi:energy-coupling factor transporter ATP-binding protein EcfA2
MIELAAGFHSELTGRENIYLQGAVHGMSRREVAARFDAIAGFADIGPFLDTPLKHYSTGMQARLGFSVAASLEPDVLLVDEVLAVGDWAFQRRAAERLREVVNGGVPVILVSHQLDRVRELCTRAILLREGTIAHAGTPDSCIAAYVAAESGAATADAPVLIEQIRLDTTGEVTPGTQVRAYLRGTVLDPARAPQATVGVRLVVLPSEEAVFAAHSAAAGITLPRDGAFELEFTLSLNVGAGPWRLQGFVLHLPDERLWAAGPSVLVQVARAPLGVGRVWLEPGIRLVPR